LVKNKSKMTLKEFEFWLKYVYVEKLDKFG
jgi:hypothetical protein